MASLETVSDNVQGQDDSGCVQDEPSPSKSDAEPPPPRVNLLDLSDDVLLWILQYCDSSDLKALGFSCRRLGLLICDRSLWGRVVSRVQPCGAERLRWFLTVAHEHTKAVLLTGHARPDIKRKSEGSSDEEAGSSRDRCPNCDSEMAPKSSLSNMPPSPTGSSSSSSCSPPCGHAHSTAHLAMLEENIASCMRNYSDAFGFLDSGTQEPEPDPIFTATPSLLRQLAARCPRLHTLELTHCNLDWSATNMSQFPPTLKRLSFRGCRSYRLPSDKSCMFRIHQHLPLLEELDVSSFDGVEGVTLLPVSKLPALRRLRMRNCRRLRDFVAYASLSARYGFRRLQVLDVRGSTFTDSEISAFGWLPHLEELYISPEYREDCSPIPAELVERELEDWELEEPPFYKCRRLPSPAPGSPPRSPPPGQSAVFTVTIDRRLDSRRVDARAPEHLADDADANGVPANGNDPDGNLLERGENDALLLENARHGVHRNIRGRDVIFFVGGHPEIHGLPANVGGDGNVIIVVGGRNANRNAPGNDAAENDAPRNDAPRNDAPRNDAPRNDAGDQGENPPANGNDAENAPGNEGVNAAPMDNSNDTSDEENGSGDGPPAKKQRLSLPSTSGQNSNDNSNESTSNASIDNNAGSSNDAGPSSANDENRPRRYVKFRRNLPPVVVTEDENAPGPAQNAPGPAQNAPGPAQNAPGPAQNAPSPDHAVQEQNEGQVRQPNPQHPIHVQRPLPNHRFFIQIENEQFENNRPYRRQDYRIPIARNARRVPGALLGLRNYHLPIHPALLVTDVTLKKFGHSDDEDEHVIRIDQLGAALGHSDRPNKSKLKRLVCSGYVRITNRSLSHLATAAPDLMYVDMRGTKVNEAGVKAFKALRPDCEVLYDP